MLSSTVCNAFKEYENTPDEWRSSPKNHERFTRGLYDRSDQLKYDGIISLYYHLLVICWIGRSDKKNAKKDFASSAFACFPTYFCSR